MQLSDSDISLEYEYYQNYDEVNSHYTPNIAKNSSNCPNYNTVFELTDSQKLFKPGETTLLLKNISMHSFKVLWQI